MKYVYKAVMNTQIIDAFNTTEYIEEPEDSEIGYFSNKKKALDSIVDTIDNNIEWIISTGNKVDVSLYDKVDYDISCRIERYGFIEWHLGRVERIKVM